MTTNTERVSEIQDIDRRLEKASKSLKVISIKAWKEQMRRRRELVNQITRKEK